MFYRFDGSAPGTNPLDVILPDATPRQLRALARYHEHQAKILHTAAQAVERSQLRRDERTHIFGAHRRAFLCTGAKIALLITRGMRSADALADMRRRTGYETSVLRAALAAWRRHRKKMLGIGKLRRGNSVHSGPGESEPGQRYP